uniref:Hyaluronan/mRNA-binding protein domain-containing protein n=1 Tax=Aegilops tauschii subsp. strangulata TaxID=200361 RepID=A0A453A393_AEGTS
MTSNQFDLGGGGYAAPRLEDGDGKQAERGRGPRQPYRGGGGRRGGYSDGQNTDEFGRPHRSYERRSGTGRGFGMKRDGAGRGNWGTATDEGFPQLRLIQLVSVSWHDADSFCCCHVWSLMLFIMWVVVIRENVEAVNTEETPAVTEDEKKPEDAPQPEAEKVKEGAENEEDQKEAEEDKVYFSEFAII